MMSNPSDHDLLIVVTTKLDQLSIDIKELKDGTTKTLADHEMRMTSLEKVIAEVNVEKSISLLEKHEAWIHDFNVRFTFLLFLAGGLGGIITWVINSVKNLPIWN